MVWNGANDPQEYDDDTCNGCSCSGDPEAEHGCGISPECRHNEPEPSYALAYEVP